MAIIMIDIDEVSQESDSEDSSAPYQLTAEIWMVPCSIDARANSFVPLVHPSDDHLSDRGQNRQIWSSREDEVLKTIVTDRGIKAWTAIASELNGLVHCGHQVRHGKQCRERWFNHLDPCLRKGNWTATEDLVILEKQLELGNKWSEIAKIVKGRNENSVKNRWKSMMRKAQKELPPGTDLARWLIAEKTNQQMEVTDGSSVQLYSPVVYSSPALAAFSMGWEVQAAQPSSALPVPMKSIDSVRRSLLTMESSPQMPTWSPYAFKDPKDVTLSPSTFLAF